MTATAAQITRTQDMATAATNAEIREVIARGSALVLSMTTPDAQREQAKIVLNIYRAEMAGREAIYAARAQQIATERREAEMAAGVTYTTAPAVVDTRPATTAQIAYLRKLIAADPGSCFVAPNLTTITRSAASAAITAYKNEV